MHLFRTTALVGAGIAIGVAVTLTLSPAPALAQQQSGAGTRLVITQAGGAQTPSNVPSTLR